MDALDLAAVLEMADMLGIGGIERLVFQESGQLRLGLTAQARLLLLAAFGLDAFVLFLLRADRVGLGQVDVLAPRPFLRRRLLVLRFVLRAASCVRGFAALLRRRRLALFGLWRAEAQAQQLILEGVAHRCISNAVGAARWRRRR